MSDEKNTGEVWWRVRFGKLAGPVEVERTSTACLWVKTRAGATRRINKITDHEQHYPSRKEAVDAIVAEAERALRGAEDSLDRAEQSLSQARALYDAEEGS